MGLRRNKKLKTWLAGSQPVRVAGSRPQGPVRGLGARAPRAWGPAHQGPGPFPHKNQLLKLRFFRKPPGGSLAKAWVSAETAALEVGTWRETKPGYRAVREKGRGFSPSPPSETIQHAPQGRRTLNSSVQPLQTGWVGASAVRLLGWCFKVWGVWGLGFGGL